MITTVFSSVLMSIISSALRAFAILIVSFQIWTES
nr:MAG TPA: hypothetical protein [Caudoviricetes sp.]